MKTATKIINQVMAIIGLIMITGCVGPLYTTESRHTAGKGWGLFGSEGATLAKADRMALNKLQATPVQALVTNGVPQGYRGLVANLSSHNRYNFKVCGPETKSYLLGPGERAIDYLVPGRYTCSVYRAGRIIGQWTFHSGVQQSRFLGGEAYHWYVYTER